MSKIKRIKSHVLGLEAIRALPYFDRVRITIARHHKMREYEDYCDTHGVGPFSTDDEDCVRCMDERRGPRAAARKAGLIQYPATCVDCGPNVMHGVRSGKCLTCYNAAGVARNPTAWNQPRAWARREGALRYRGTCETHGSVDFSTHTGKCLTCYNASGYPRLPVAPSARAAARHAGERTYLATCETCGEAPHHVHSGKCAVCCTASGGRTLRALARTHGHAEYVSRCEIHGDAYHETATGRCLKCIA